MKFGIWSDILSIRLPLIIEESREFIKMLCIRLGAELLLNLVGFKIKG